MNTHVYAFLDIRVALMKCELGRNIQVVRNSQADHRVPIIFDINDPSPSNSLCGTLKILKPRSISSCIKVQDIRYERQYRSEALSECRS